MGYYFNFRGFIECDFGDFEKIHDIVDCYRLRGAEYHLSDSMINMYLDGWVYQQRTINWIAYAFFGATMKFSGVLLLKDVLRSIAEELPEADGRFFVEGEDEGRSKEWVMLDGEVLIPDDPGAGR